MMQSIESFKNLYDSFFEERKVKIFSKIQNDIEKHKYSYPPHTAKLDLFISLIAKIYSIDEKILKDREYANNLGVMNKNYREASAMVYFICLKKLNWSWNDVVNYFKTNKPNIYRYISSLEESKDKQFKEKYLYVMSKIDAIDF